MSTTVVIGLFISTISTFALVAGFFYTLVISPLRDDIRDMRSDLKVLQTTFIPRPEVEKLLSDERSEVSKLVGELNQEIIQMNKNCVERSRK